MEAKLAEYRARKRKQAMLSAAKELLSNPLGSKTLEPSSPGSLPLEEDAQSETAASEISESESLLSDSAAEVIPRHATWFTVVTYCLYITLWGTVYCIAIHYEFGTVYLIVSALYGIWINTRTGPKRKGERWRSFDCLSYLQGQIRQVSSQVPSDKQLKFQHCNIMLQDHEPGLNRYLFCSKLLVRNSEDERGYQRPVICKIEELLPIAL